MAKISEMMTRAVRDEAEGMKEWKLVFVRYDYFEGVGSHRGYIIYGQDWNGSFYKVAHTKNKEINTEPPEWGPEEWEKESKRVGPLRPMEVPPEEIKELRLPEKAIDHIDQITINEHGIGINLCFDYQQERLKNPSEYRAIIDSLSKYVDSFSIEDLRNEMGW